MNFSDNEKIAGKKNYTGIAFVVVLHLIAGYGIVSGLGKKMISKMIEPVETKIIAISFGVISLTVAIGWFNSREVINTPPLQVLRKEG